MPDLDKLIKAYDIRGTVPDQFNEDLARQIGAAYAHLVNDTVIVVRDMRASSVPLAAAFIEGVTSQGHNVIDAGLGSTDLLYFASGWEDLPGAVFTASHNPAQYNGIKLCKAGARPVGAGHRTTRHPPDAGNRCARRDRAAGHRDGQRHADRVHPVPA